MALKAYVSETSCTGCFSCVGLCPKDAITVKDNVAIVMALFCNGCGLCVEGCGEEAIEVIESS